MQNATLLIKATVSFDHFVAVGIEQYLSVEGQPLAAEEVEYLSDWLHLWLLSGKHKEFTLGSYTRYMQVVPLVFGRAQWIAESRPIRGLLPVRLDGRPGYLETDYVVPASLSLDMFEWCTQPHIRSLRADLIQRFVSSPSTYRYDFVM